MQENNSANILKTATKVHKAGYWYGELYCEFLIEVTSNSAVA